MSFTHGVTNKEENKREKDTQNNLVQAHKLYLHNTLKHIYNVYLSRLEQQELELILNKNLEVKDDIIFYKNSNNITGYQFDVLNLLLYSSTF